MKSYTVRTDVTVTATSTTDAGAPNPSALEAGASDTNTPSINESDAMVLTWGPGSPAADIDCGKDFFTGWRPTRPAADLFLLAAAAYCVDKVSPREETADGWTRDLGLSVPVATSGQFPSGSFGRALSFLTGDRWRIATHQAEIDPLAALPVLVPTVPPIVDIDAVSLFSGGLDSLCGVIDLLEADPGLRLGLVAHYDGGQAQSKQTLLHQRLADTYGAHRVVLRRLWLRPAAHDARRGHVSPPTAENTTRGRSLLFLAAALTMASSVSPHTPVYLPENGYIALNVPLTRARIGSASTRTTHPHFLQLLGEATRAAGVANPLINPCSLQTKGEMMLNSRNPKLLRELAPLTVSCSHPEAARMQERPQGNCGYCFPCLIRRSSLAVAGWDDEDYAWDALTDSSLIDQTELQRGADLRAVLNGVFTARPDSDLLRNAPLPAGSHTEHLGVWRRGNDEIRSWLQAGAQGSLVDVVRRRS